MIKIWRWIKSHWTKIISLDDTPHALSLGLAIGIFFGFTPLFGLKTLLAIGLAWALRGNRLAAAIMVTLHDVFLPVMPVILRWEYDLGYWLLSHPHAWPPTLHLAENLHPSTWMKWSSFFTIGYPLLLGSLIVSLPLSIGFYFFIRSILQRLHDSRTSKSI